MKLIHKYYFRLNILKKFSAIFLLLHNDLLYNTKILIIMFLNMYSFELIIVLIANLNILSLIFYVFFVSYYSNLFRNNIIITYLKCLKVSLHGKLNYTIILIQMRSSFFVLFFWFIVSNFPFPIIFTSYYRRRVIIFLCYSQCWVHPGPVQIR